jgi:hypothetical protein
LSDTNKPSFKLSGGTQGLVQESFARLVLYWEPTLLQEALVLPFIIGAYHPFLTTCILAVTPQPLSWIRETDTSRTNRYKYSDQSKQRTCQPDIFHFQQSPFHIHPEAPDKISGSWSCAVNLLKAASNIALISLLNSFSSYLG